MKLSFDVKKQKRFFQRKSQVVLIYGFLVVLAIVSGIMNQYFFTAGNLKNLVATSFPYILVAFGQTLVILTGGIDLSVGSIVSVSNAICAVLMTQTPGGFIAGFTTAAMTGIAVGAINGILVTKGMIQPIIVTLATQTAVSGAALAILTAPGGTTNYAFAAAMSGKFAGIPVSLLLLAVVTVFMWVLLNKTRFGISVYAIGGNEDAAYSTGITVGRKKIAVYTLSGFLSALAGIFLSSQMYSGDPRVGVNLTMTSITTVVIGGTALSGGKGGIIGSLAGVFILVIINNLLNLINVSSFYQYVLQGGILILAIAIGSIRTRRA